MAEVASTFVSVVPSARGFGRSLDGQIGGDIDSSGKRAGTRFGGFFKAGAFAAVGAGLALGKFLGDSLGEAREAQKVGALTNAVIKSAGGVANVTSRQVETLSSSLSKKIGVDDEAIQAGANMLLTFGRVRNEVGKGNKIFDQATVAASDMAAAFGGDAVSNSRLLGKALNDPARGVTALTRVGVSFTQGQKDQIKAMQESGDILGAQKLILGEVTKQTGGAAAATATAGDKFKVAFGNLQESVGNALLPLVDRVLSGMTRLADFVSANLGPAFSRIGTFLAPVKAAITGLFASFYGGGGQVSGVLAKFTAIGSYLGANLIPIFQRVGAIIATQVVPIILSLGRFMVGTLYPAFLRIAMAVGRNLKPVLDALFSVIRGSVIPAMQGLLVKFRQAQPTIQRVISVVVQVIGTVLRMASAIVGKVLPSLIRFAGFLIRNVVRAVSAGISIVVKIIGIFFGLGAAVGRAIGAFVRFSNAVDSNIRSALRIIGSIPGRAKSALGNLGSTLYNSGRDLIAGLARGIADKIGDAIDAVRAGLSKIKDMVPGSPIKAGPLKGWNNQGPTGPGGRLIGNLIAGIDSQAPALEASMTRLTSRVAVPRANFSASLSATGANAAGGRGVPTVHIEQMVTHDPYAAAYALRTEQAKALTLAGMP